MSAFAFLLLGCQQSNSQDKFSVTCNVTRKIVDNNKVANTIVIPYQIIVFENNSIKVGEDSATCSTWTKDGIGCKNIKDNNNEDSYLFNRTSGSYKRVGKSYDSHYQIQMVYEDDGICTAENKIIKTDGRADVWVPVANESYLLEATNRRNVFLVASRDANTGRVMVSFLNTNNETCKEDGTTFDLGSNRYYTINNRAIQMRGVCINGNELQIPNGEQEKNYLVSLAKLGGIVTIDSLAFDVTKFGTISNKFN
jgi:hypothetical protein